MEGDKIVKDVLNLRKLLNDSGIIGVTFMKGYNTEFLTIEYKGGLITGYMILWDEKVLIPTVSLTSVKVSPPDKWHKKLAKKLRVKVLDRKELRRLIFKELINQLGDSE